MRLEIGKIDKAHGVRGDVIVSLLSDRTERLDPGSTLYHDGGVYTVVASRPHQHRFLVTLAEISGREQADAARGTTLYADAIDDPDVVWIHDLIARPVVTVEGDELGVVDAVEENPASDLLVLADGSLIPLAFFVEQRDDGTIVVDPPDGLFDPVDASGPALEDD
jgi:16S rRNA processing protein RimM